MVIVHIRGKGRSLEFKKGRKKEGKKGKRQKFYCRKRMWEVALRKAKHVTVQDPQSANRMEGWHPVYFYEWRTSLSNAYFSVMFFIYFRNIHFLLFCLCKKHLNFEPMCLFQGEKHYLVAVFAFKHF